MLTGIINNRRFLSKTKWGSLGMSNFRKVSLMHSSSPSLMPLYTASIREGNIVRITFQSWLTIKTCIFVEHATSLASWATLSHVFNECTSWNICSISLWNPFHLYKEVKLKPLSLVNKRFSGWSEGRMLALPQLDCLPLSPNKHRVEAPWGSMMVGNAGFTLVLPSPVDWSISPASPTGSR